MFQVVEEITREMLLLAKSCSKVYRDLASNVGEAATWYRSLDPTEHVQIHTAIKQLRENSYFKDKDEL